MVHYNNEAFSHHMRQRKRTSWGTHVEILISMRGDRGGSAMACSRTAGGNRTRKPWRVHATADTDLAE
ncbi:unnamed protein product [Heligmosomoides polygyrus]|uniref:DUF1534 domain-containing protein n=1 Tax=Heligmosomoides polygyrus TaxID=6339 RepID=A0A183FNL2_HELPZ|nr:unnamed protein product [Heligmosomoides polygyrus]